MRTHVAIKMMSNVHYTYYFTGIMQDSDKKIQGVFKDHSRTKTKIFKEF